MKKIRVTIIGIVLLFCITLLVSACSKGSQNEQVKEEKKKTQEEIWLEEMTLEEKVAQLFMITPEQLTGYGQVIKAGEVTEQALKEYPVGGMILFANNIEDDEQLKTMMKGFKKINDSQREVPIFLGIDEEGGQVARIANSGKCNVKKTEDMKTLGRRSSEDVYQAASYIGGYLREYGFNVDFAPVADVSNGDTADVIRSRSFGNDPEKVSKMVTAYLKGLTEQEILGAVKHFPGQGSVKQDTHLESGYISKSFDEMMDTDLLPFQTAIKKEVPFVMVSHMIPGGRDSNELPSSMNKKVVDELLRDQLGYENIVITDAFNMAAISNHYSSDEAAIKAIQAGVDMILMPEDFQKAYQGVMKAVEDGRISEERIDESVKRILKIKLAWLKN